MNIIKNILRTALAAGLLLFAFSAYAQQKMTVRGTVTDSNGEPVIGAAVLLEGSSTGVVTDNDGKYSISFTPKSGAAARLVYSSIAYLSETVEVKNRSVIDVTLRDDTQQLDEVVVVGYGAMRRSDLTGSVTSVKIDESQAAQTASIDQLLQGHAAGVQVVSNSSAPDAGINITIRGASSFNSNSQPLYVVDGVIMNTDGEIELSTHMNAGSATDEATNGLMGINPQDIASMEILKDASATAIYGSQGANGVILITTKTANREKPVITFSAGIDVSTMYKRKDMMSYDQFCSYLDLIGESHTSERWVKFHDKVEDGTYEPVDWQDYTTRTGISQRYFFSIAGRPKTANYRLSMGYTDSQGIVKGTGFKNLSIRLNLDKTVGRFSFGTKTSFSYINSQMAQGSSKTYSTSATSLIRSMYGTHPLMYVEDLDDEGIEMEDPDAPLSGPNRWLKEFQNQRKEIRITPSVYAQINILPWLKFKSTFGADLRVTEQGKFKSKRINNQETGSSGSFSNVNRINWNWDNLFLVNKKFGRHKLSGTLGQSASSSSSIAQTYSGANVEQYKSMLNSLNYSERTWLEYGESYNQLMSFFGRAVYNYADRYVLTATYRFDGSSKFAGTNKWAQFPSAAFAWRINQEPWFKVPVISMAKIRLGWGKVGNQGIPSYQTRYNYDMETISSHESATGKTIGVYSQNLPNYDLKWETTTQYNAGIDLGLWKGRLSLEADWYYKVTDDLLQAKTVSVSSGISNPYVNMGSILNTGFEITLNATPVLTKDFEWNIGGNFTLNRNRILSIDPSGLSTKTIYLDRNQEPQTVEYFTGSALGTDQVCHDYLNIFAVGQPMGLFYGLAVDGFVQPGETGVPFATGAERGEGSINYLDLNGDGVIDDNDRCVIGDPNPDFTYGFNTSFRYKRLNLSANFVGSYGNDLFNQERVAYSNTNLNRHNMLNSVVTDQWSIDNQNASNPKLGTMQDSDVYYVTEFWVEDASYLRLSNVTLSYDIPMKRKSFFIKGINVGVTGKNLVVWTKYSGNDPDVNSFGSLSRRGVDNGSYPSARSFLFDLKFTF